MAGVKSGAAAQRYARAVFSIGVESGEFERLGQEIESVVDAMGQDETLSDILVSPLHDLSSRRQLVTALANKKGFSSTVKNFLLLLVDNGRASLLPEISRSYQQLSDEKAGRMKATVITASKVAESVVGELKSSLEKSTGKKVSLTSEVDSALVGGIVIKVGDIVYDGSIRTQLQLLKDSIRKTA